MVSFGFRKKRAIMRNRKHGTVRKNAAQAIDGCNKGDQASGKNKTTKPKRANSDTTKRKPRHKVRCKNCH